MVCLSRSYPLKFFKGCLPQNLLHLLLNTSSHLRRFQTFKMELHSRCLTVTEEEPPDEVNPRKYFMKSSSKDSEYSLHKKWNNPLRISSVNATVNPQFPAILVTFTKGIINGKLLLCAVIRKHCECKVCWSWFLAAFIFEVFWKKGLLEIRQVVLKITNWIDFSCCKLLLQWAVFFCAISNVWSDGQTLWC